MHRQRKDGIQEVLVMDGGRKKGVGRALVAKDRFARHLFLDFSPYASTHACTRKSSCLIKFWVTFSLLANFFTRCTHRTKIQTHYIFTYTSLAY